MKTAGKIFAHDFKKDIQAQKWGVQSIPYYWRGDGENFFLVCVYNTNH